MNPLIVGNWKMNLDLAESLVLSGQISKRVESIKGVDVTICPPSVFIYPIFDYLKARPSNLYLGLQNISFEDEGAFTGEISPMMVKGVADFVIIGHSERRRYFLESDELINKKVKFALAKNLKTILCVGEKERFHLEEYYEHEVKRMSAEGGILREIELAIRGIDKAKLKNLSIAYEPIWAIGTGNAATGAYAAAVCYIIKNYLREKVGSETASMIRILYGGSAEDGNTKEFLMQPSVNGLLVGGASLKSAEFAKIAQIAAEVKNGR
jgi:triosephosphate isomerase